MMAPEAFAGGYRTTYLAAAPASTELRSTTVSLRSTARRSLTLQSPTHHHLSDRVDR